MVVPGFERQNLNTIASAYIGLVHISSLVGLNFLPLMKIKHLIVEKSSVITYFLSYEDYIGAAPFFQIISN